MDLVQAPHVVALQVERDVGEAEIPQPTGTSCVRSAFTAIAQGRSAGVPGDAGDIVAKPSGGYFAVGGTGGQGRWKGLATRAQEAGPGASKTGADTRRHEIVRQALDSI